jgi:phosphatidyl-myo-inositol dimannoside synthase
VVTAPAVNLLTHEFAPFTGGIATYVEETARALAAQGRAVTVWAPDYRRVQDDGGFPFAVRRVATRGKQDWLCRIRMALALRAGFPGGRIPGTVILAEPGPLRMWMYPRLLRLPRPGRLVLVLHGSEILHLAQPARRRRRFQRLAAAADGVGVVSAAVGALLEASAPGMSGGWLAVPGAVRRDWQGLPPVERERDPEVLEVLQVGRISPRKGQQQLIAAVALLPEPLRQRVRVRLVGPTGKAGYQRGLLRAIRETGVAAALEGNLAAADLRAAYERAAVTVMPSQPSGSSVEGLGLALLEAQHFGCPVVGSRLGGIGEALREGETGLLAPPGDPAALAKALEALLGDPARRAGMGMAGARFVRASFSWERNARQLAGEPATPVNKHS